MNTIFKKLHGKFEKSNTNEVADRVENLTESLLLVGNRYDSMEAKLDNMTAMLCRVLQCQSTDATPEQYSLSQAVVAALEDDEKTGDESEGSEQGEPAQSNTNSDQGPHVMNPASTLSESLQVGEGAAASLPQPVALSGDQETELVVKPKPSRLQPLRSAKLNTPGYLAPNVLDGQATASTASKGGSGATIRTTNTPLKITRKELTPPPGLERLANMYVPPAQS